MSMEVTVSNEGVSDTPPGDPVATLAAEAVQSAAEAEAALVVIESQVEQVAAEVEAVAEKAVDFAAHFLRVDEWMQQTGQLLTQMVEAQAQMMENQTALSLAMSSPMIPPNLSEQAVDGIPTIVPASDASPSDPVAELPVAQAEAVLENLEQKVTRWI